VRIRCTGVCATDTHRWASSGLIPPAVFGHEWTGTVLAAGAGVTTGAVEDRVVASVGPPSGSCACAPSGMPTTATPPSPKTTGSETEPPRKAPWPSTTPLTNAASSAPSTASPTNSLGSRMRARLFT